MNYIHILFQHFIKHPYLSACLVFDDHHFIGIVLKKDIKLKLDIGDTDLSDSIIEISYDKLEEFVFNKDPSLRMKIPYINKEGKIIDSIYYDEFVSEFYPQDFSIKLSFHEVFDYWDHPVLILNRFKTVLYLNKHATEIMEKDDAFGLKVGLALSDFEFLVKKNDDLYLSNGLQEWSVQISQSHTQSSRYYIYQLFPRNDTVDFHKPDLFIEKNTL